MSMLNRNTIMRLYGRLNETHPCPKHGINSQAVCTRCDVVICLGCTGKCGCAATTPSATRMALHHLTLAYGVAANEKRVPSLHHHAFIAAEELLKTPEEKPEEPKK